MWRYYLTSDPVSPHTWDWSWPKFTNDGCGVVTFNCLFFAINYYNTQEFIIALYDYSCKNCSTEFELSKKISERDNTLSDVCPQCGVVGQMTRLVSSPIIGYSIVTGGYGKASDGWKDVMKKIHSRAPGSQMDKISSFM